MKKIWIGLLFGIVLVSIVVADADPFYLRMMEKAKARYAANQFDQALEHFQVAGFGLMADRDLLKEIYIYQALCHFKLNQAPRVQEILVKLKDEFNIKSISELEVPADIQNDVNAMRSVFEKGLNQGKKSPSGKLKTNIGLLKSVDATFQKARRYLEAKQFREVKGEIKKLKRINKKDLRIEYLQGRLGFEQKRYSECIKSLRKVYRSGSPELRTDALYYLVISYYFVKNYGQTLAFYQKMENPADKSKLETIIRKVRRERLQSIRKLAVTFNKVGFKELVKRFEGDAFICRDLLSEALAKKPPQKHQVEGIIRAGQKNPETCDIDFYLKAAQYLKNTKNIKSAIVILKKSRYYTSRKQEHIEIFYNVGVYYYKMKNWQKSLIEMTKVRNIRPGYKESDKYLDTINKLIQGG
jgi:tetratricopeptide (TPR) repeat protein